MRPHWALGKRPTAGEIAFAERLAEDRAAMWVGGAAVAVMALYAVVIVWAVLR